MQKPETSLPITRVTVTTLLLHLMLRRSVNAWADSILDGVEHGAHALVRASAVTFTRISHALTPSLSPPQVSQRTLGASSHA